MSLEEERADGSVKARPFHFQHDPLNPNMFIDWASTNDEEATKEFFSSIAGRTRAKRYRCSHPIAVPRRRDVEAASDSGGISAPRYLFERTTAGISPSDSSSSDHTRQKKRKRNQSMLTRRVGRPRKNSGKESSDMDMEGVEIIDETEFRCRKRCSASNIGHPAREDSYGFSAGTSLKTVHIVGNKHSASPYFSPEDVRHGTDRGLLAQEGSDRDNMVPEEMEFEKIDEAEFRNHKTLFGSNIRCSIEQGLSAASSSKNVHGASKTLSSADHALSQRNHCTGSYTLAADSHLSANKGSDSDNMVPEEMEIEKIEEAEFKNRKTLFGSNIICSIEQGLSAASSSKNVHGASKTLSSADHALSHRNYCTDSDTMAADSHLSAKKGSDSDNMDPEEIEVEIIDEAEFRNWRLSGSKIGCSIEQGLCSASSSKNGHGASKTLSSAYHAVSHRYYCTSSDTMAVDSHPLAKKGGDSDNMVPEQIEIEKIDEAEFRNRKTLSGSKIRCSIEQSLCSASSRKNGHGASKTLSSDHDVSHRYCCTGSDTKAVDSHPTAKTENKDEDLDPAELGIEKIDESEFRNKRTCSDLNPEELDNDNTDECTGSHASSESNSNNTESFLQDDEISSHGEKQELNLGIAGRTRSKMGSMKKPPEIVSSSMDLSLDSVFSSSSEGEEFSSRMLRNDAASKQTDESNKTVAGDPKAKEGQKKKKQNDESNKTVAGDPKAKEGQKKKKQNDESNKTVAGDPKAKEGQKKKKNKSNIPKSTFSKQSHAQKECDEPKEVNALHPEDQSQAQIKSRNKEASSSHMRDDKDVDIHEKIETTSSEIHDDGKVGKVEVAAEIKEPTTKKQASSKYPDFCSMLADAILGNGSVLEMGIVEETAQASPSQTQNTIPLKFRFEDEVPKEVEKTDHEKEMEALFADLNSDWALEEPGSYNNPEVDQAKQNSPDVETQHARCAKGKHELILKDEEGLVCIFCHHVEHEPKDILPPWVDFFYQDSGKRRHHEAEQEKSLEFDDGLHIQSSINNVMDFGYSADGTVWSLKPGIQESMYEHQREGFEFLWKNLAGSINLDELKNSDPEVGGCIISHAPGTGKSRLTIVFIETYLKMFPHCRPVIIGPASMLLTWEEEFRKWKVEFPFLNLNNPELLGKENMTALRFLSKAKGRKARNMDVIRMIKIRSWSMRSSILGISYSLFEKLTGENMKGKTSKKSKTLDDQMQKIRKILLEMPGLVILDEGHTPRNQRSNIWNALLKLHTEKRVILSGTPFQNNFAELFNTLRLVRPAIAGALVQERMFSEMIASRRTSSSRKSNGECSQFPLISEDIDRAVDKLKISMAPFVHVHKGTILLQNLPGLRDCVVLLKPPALQKSLIERLEGSQNTFEFEHKVALISVHPYLFQHFESTEEQRNGIDMGALEASKLNPNEGVKTKFILELIRLSKVMKEKVLIFSQYIQPLELIKEQLKESFKWVDGKEILQMQGRLEQKQRQVLINVFNDPKSEAKVMLASTRCCSEGISLIGASRVVLLDVVWNPSVERQAICRAYRIGQEKFVYTYHLMTSGTTEADKYCRQAEKERLSELVFTSSSNETNKQKHPSGIEDRILEAMLGHDNLKGMFEKIINQPKDTNLVQTFGLTS